MTRAARDVDLISYILMGNNTSRKTTKQTREQKQYVRDELVQKRVDQIERFQEQILVSGENQQLSVRDQVDLLGATEIAKAQVQRGDAALTKADLVAIVLRLKNEIDINRYAQLTVKDLNVLIRSLIYAPPPAAVSLSLEQSRNSTARGPAFIKSS